MAYISTYKSIKSMNDIIYGKGLENIDAKYGHYNGYYELLQLGLVIFNAFSNYPANYDSIINNGKEIFSCKYPNKLNGEDLYYNDLLYGVMLNPMHIKNQFLKYCTEEDWNELNTASSSILNNFQNGRNIDKVGVNRLLKLSEKYFNRKVLSCNNDLSSDIIKRLQQNFHERLEYAKGYYNIQQEKNLIDSGEENELKINRESHQKNWFRIIFNKIKETFTRRDKIKMLSGENANVSDVNTKNKFIEGLRTNTPNIKNVNNENYQFIDKHSKQIDSGEKEK